MYLVSQNRHSIPVLWCQNGTLKFVQGPRFGMWGWAIRLGEMFHPVACNLVPQFQEISQQLAPDKLKVANEEFRTMEDLGIVQL